MKLWLNEFNWFMNSLCNVEILNWNYYRLYRLYRLSHPGRCHKTVKNLHCWWNFITQWTNSNLFSQITLKALSNHCFSLTRIKIIRREDEKLMRKSFVSWANHTWQLELILIQFLAGFLISYWFFFIINAWRMRFCLRIIFNWLHTLKRKLFNLAWTSPILYHRIQKPVSTSKR